MDDEAVRYEKTQRQQNIDQLEALRQKCENGQLINLPEFPLTAAVEGSIFSVEGNSLPSITIFSDDLPVGSSTLFETHHTSTSTRDVLISQSSGTMMKTTQGSSMSAVTRPKKSNKKMFAYQQCPQFLHHEKRIRAAVKARAYRVKEKQHIELLKSEITQIKQEIQSLDIEKKTLNERITNLESSQ